MENQVNHTEREEYKLFLWVSVDDATLNWHDEGAVVVIDKSLEAAREQLKTQVPDKCGAFTEEPDFVCSVEPQEPKHFIFPDAGCC
jgi:hypothetical protein